MRKKSKLRTHVIDIKIRIDILFKNRIFKTVISFDYVAGFQEIIRLKDHDEYIFLHTIVVNKCSVKHLNFKGKNYITVRKSLNHAPIFEGYYRVRTLLNHAPFYKEFSTSNRIKQSSS